MQRNNAMLDLIIRAVLKLGATAEERRNVVDAAAVRVRHSA